MTTKDSVDEGIQDIITQVRQLIDEKRVDDAVELILSVEDDIRQIFIVSAIDIQSVNSIRGLYPLVQSKKLSDMLVMSSLFARDVALVRISTRFDDPVWTPVGTLLNLLEDSVEFISILYSNYLDSAVRLTNKIINNIAKYRGSLVPISVLNQNVSLSQEVCALVSTFYMFTLHTTIQELSAEQSYVDRTIRRVLEYHFNEYALPITFEGVDSITAGVLENEFVPMFRALRDMQEVLCEWRGIEFKESTIEEMKPGSIIADLKNVLDAVIEFKWGRQKRDTEQEKLEIDKDIAYLDREIRLNQVRQIQQPSLDMSDEIAKKEEQMATLLLKQRELDDKANRWYIEQASDFVERNAPHLSIDEKLEYVLRVAKSYRDFDSSSLSMKLYADPPKPKNLPPSYKDNQPPA